MTTHVVSFRSVAPRSDDLRAPGVKHPSGLLTQLVKAAKFKLANTGSYPTSHRFTRLPMVTSHDNRLLGDSFDIEALYFHKEYFFFFPFSFSLFFSIHMYKYVYAKVIPLQKLPFFVMQTRVHDLILPTCTSVLCVHIVCM